jgi:hypothetical protein
MYNFAYGKNDILENDQIITPPWMKNAAWYPPQLWLLMSSGSLRLEQPE